MGWDALNHHIYLGRQALEGSRLDWDHFAAGGMSCQYPQSYAPLVAMLDSGFTGLQIFLVLGSICALAIPAVWMIAWCILPMNDCKTAQLRMMATALAFCTSIWWSLLLQTSNDGLGLVAGLWSLALVLTVTSSARWRERTHARLATVGLAGALTGLAIIIKLSLAITGIGALVILMFFEGTIRSRVLAMMVFSVFAAITCLLLGYNWGMDTWRICGSPLFPFLTEIPRPISLGGAP